MSWPVLYCLLPFFFFSVAKSMNCDSRLLHIGGSHRVSTQTAKSSPRPVSVRFTSYAFKNCMKSSTRALRILYSPDMFPRVFWSSHSDSWKQIATCQWCYWYGVSRAGAGGDDDPRDSGRERLITRRIFINDDLTAVCDAGPDGDSGISGRVRRAYWLYVIKDNLHDIPARCVVGFRKQKDADSLTMCGSRMTQSSLCSSTPWSKPIFRIL